MKMKLGAIVTEMSGKLGGHCVSNYGGQVVLAKNKQGGTFGSNSAARGVRYRSAVAANWRQLTQAERQGYSQIGQNNVKSFNANNSLINATGYEVNFQRVASELLFGAPQTDDPTHTNTAHVEIQGVFVSGVYPDFTNVQLFTNILPQFSKLRLRISEPIPHGINTPRKRWDKAKAIVTTGNPPFNITSLLDEWIIKDVKADHFYLEAQVQDEWGNLSPKVYYRVDFYNPVPAPHIEGLRMKMIEKGTKVRIYGRITPSDNVVFWDGSGSPQAGKYNVEILYEMPTMDSCVIPTTSPDYAETIYEKLINGDYFEQLAIGWIPQGWDCSVIKINVYDTQGVLYQSAIAELDLTNVVPPPPDVKAIILSEYPSPHLVQVVGLISNYNRLGVFNQGDNFPVNRYGLRVFISPAQTGVCEQGSSAGSIPTDIANAMLQGNAYELTQSSYIPSTGQCLQVDFWVFDPNLNVIQKTTKTLSKL